MKKHEVLNLDKIDRKVLFDELKKGVKDIEAGRIVSIKGTKAKIKEKHAAYLRSYSVETSRARSS